VLERIRDETPLVGGEPRTGVPPAAPAIAPSDIDIEEATVAFIVRERAVPAPQPAPPPAAPAAGEAQGPAASNAATDSGEEDGTEAEVRIVPRRG
jgi:hypothetical protein